jgi:hypothetical protein
MELCYNDISEIENNFQDYQINSQEYTENNEYENNEHFQQVPELFDIDYNIHIIEWIHEFIMNCNFEFSRIDMNTNIIYNNVINRLKEITNKYFEIKEDIDYHSLHYLYNPEDFFDEIFYCRGQNKFWFKKYNEAKELLDKFELMSYTIYNYNAEKEFEKSITI